MAKNNQKREKALRNLENARKYRKKSTDKRRRGPGPGPRPAGPSAGSSVGPSANPSVGPSAGPSATAQ